FSQYHSIYARSRAHKLSWHHVNKYGHIFIYHVIKHEKDKQQQQSLPFAEKLR
ncbi:1496_t:CDS:1, partial [Entrophospora sp. SA101]